MPETPEPIELELPPWQEGVRAQYRGLDFFDPQLHQPRVTIVGAGGIGGPTIYQLAKLGIKRITVIDDDLVATHNLATTPYSPQHVGMPKVLAIGEVVKPFDCEVVPIKGRSTLTDPLIPMDTEILISAVDSMDARRHLWAWAKARNVSMYLDGRIGGENLRVYAVRPEDAEDRARYDRSLVRNEDVADLPCTGQQVVDVGWTTSAWIVRAFRRWAATGRWQPEIIHDANVHQTVVAREKDARQPDQVVVGRRPSPPKEKVIRFRDLPTLAPARKKIHARRPLPRVPVKRRTSKKGKKEKTRAVAIPSPRRRRKRLA